MLHFYNFWVAGIKTTLRGTNSVKQKFDRSNFAASYFVYCGKLSFSYFQNKNKQTLDKRFATTLIRLHLLISERNNTVDSSNGCVCVIVWYMNFDINVTKNLLLSQLFVLISAINTATVVAEAKMNQESFLKTLEDRFKYRFDNKGIGREVSTLLLVWIDVYTK